MANVTAWSVNAHLGYIKDWPKFIERMRRLNPAVILAYIDDMAQDAKIYELKSALPDTKVIARIKEDKFLTANNLSDGGFHLEGGDGGYRMSPASFLNRYGRLGQGGLVLYALNEANGYGDEARLVTWVLELIDLADARNISLCLINFATGHPAERDDQWMHRKEGENSGATFDPILIRLANSNTHFMGLHEYLPGEGWRVGRLWKMVRRCRALGINTPRCIITEWGVDATHGEKSGPNGYRSRGWTSIVYFSALNNIYFAWLKALVDSGILLGMCIFSYGNSGGWVAFDIENDKDFNELMITQAPRIEVVVPDTQPIYPIPDEANGVRVVLKALNLSTPVRFRSQPVLQNNTLNFILNPVEALAFPGVPSFEVTDGSKVFNMRVYLINGKYGWAASELLSVIIKEDDPVIPVLTSMVGALRNKVEGIKLSLHELEVDFSDLVTIMDSIGESE